MFTKILCPLDLSDFSKRAFEHGLVLARWYDAEVVALHVFSSWVPPGDLSTYPAWMRQVPQARVQIDAELRDQLQPAVDAGIEAPLVTRQGEPSAEILACARSMNADLIVLSTHGRSGFDRLALGSVTEKVLRKASCPVLVVPVEREDKEREPERKAPFAGYRRIVCAEDFSDQSIRALDFAVSLAEHGRAALTLVHVVEVADDPDVQVGGTSPLATLRRERVERAAASLRRLAAERTASGAKLEEVVRLGTAHREILAVAEETGADLVVMGVRGRGAIDMTLFGSTTNQVVRRARCDVLTVRNS